MGTKQDKRDMFKADI